MPSAKLSPALIPVQGGGVKKAGLAPTVGTKNACTTSCKK